MKRLLPIACFALLAGCNDQSGEIAKLHADLATQRAEIEDSETRRLQEQKRLQQQIDDLRAQLAAAKGVSERMTELETKASASDSAALEKKIGELEAKLERVKTEAVEAAKAEAAGGTMDEEKVAELTAKRLAEEQAANAPTKNLQQALERMEISHAEKELVRQEVVAAKKGILEALEVPTAAGRNLAVELIDTILKVQNGKAEQTDLHKLFVELTTTKLPGDATGRTYLEVINEIKAKNKQSIGRILTPEDQKKLTRAHEDWTDFEVGEGDPWGPLYLERLEAYQKRQDRLKEEGLGD